MEIISKLKESSKHVCCGIKCSEKAVWTIRPDPGQVRFFLCPSCKEEWIQNDIPLKVKEENASMAGA